VISNLFSFNLHVYLHALVILRLVLRAIHLVLVTPRREVIRAIGVTCLVYNHVCTRSTRRERAFKVSRTCGERLVLIAKDRRRALASSRLLFHPSIYLPTYPPPPHSTALASTNNHVSTPSSKPKHDRRARRQHRAMQKRTSVSLEDEFSTPFTARIVASLDISAFDAHSASFDGAYTATDGVVGLCTNDRPRTCSIT
jgi:hypothetical protein